MTVDIPQFTLCCVMYSGIIDICSRSNNNLLDHVPDVITESFYQPGQRRSIMQH
jgi:hypothetical protein